MRILSLSLILSLLLLPTFAACDDDPKNTNNDVNKVNNANNVNNVNNANNVNNVNNVNNTNNQNPELYGELELAESRQFGYENSSLSGLIGAGGFPRWQEETAVGGDCRLLKYVRHFCEGYCDGVCVAENVCEPWPSFLDAGTLTVTGAKVAITVEPGLWGFNGFENGYGWWREVADLFDDQDVITATFAGEDLAGFSVASAGVAPLVLTNPSDDELALSNDADTVLTWTPAGAAGTRVRVTLNANNLGHGAPFDAIIECDTEDDGSLTIPATLVRQFPSTYRWEYCAGSDCPLSWAFRYRSGHTDLTDGRVVFRVGSAVGFFILHDLPTKGE